MRLVFMHTEGLLADFPAAHVLGRLCPEVRNSHSQSSKLTSIPLSYMLVYAYTVLG